MRTFNIRIAISSALAAIVFLTAFLTFTGGCTVTEENGKDLTAKLYWDTGTLSPEYYYYYRITVGPSLKGVFEYQPGYGELPAPEVWKVDFEVSQGQMDTLYQLIQENNLLKNQWETTEEIAEGGSGSSLTIIYNGTEYNIPSEYALITEERSKVNAVTDYLREIVPSDIWNEMGDRQSQFEESFSNQ